MVPGVDQWAEFSFDFENGDGQTAVMKCQVITWNKSMEVEDAESLAEEIGQMQLSE
jgi:hypothetical protein